MCIGISISMLYTRNQHSVIGQLHFRNKVTEMEIRLQVGCTGVKVVKKGTKLITRKISTGNVIDNKGNIVNIVLCYIKS